MADTQPKPGLHGLVKWPVGTGVFLVIVAPTTDADQIRQMVADKLADERDVIIEEVRYVAGGDSAS